MIKSNKKLQENLENWNIRSLQGKEKELEDEFEQTKLDILVITETKTKGSGLKIMKKAHTLIYSGIEGIL